MRAATGDHDEPTETHRASDLSGLSHTAHPIPTITTHLKTAASFNACADSSGRSEDVDGHVDDDPHDVDEVPVDARHLDAEVVLRLGAEVAAEGADRREAEQHQADEDVGAVQAGEAVEDRAEAEVAGAEADVDVLVDLDEEEGRAEQPGQRPGRV